MANFKETSDAKKGGLFVGKSHDEGGIPAIVTDTGQPIEVESGEAIINKKATALHWEELSKINQSAGNGVPIPPPDEADKILEKFDNGGRITNKEKKVVYDKWKRLVNMTYTELSRYYHSKDGKESGLTKEEADKQGISSGRESCEWILKMKKTSYKNWTDEMWKWANKQISFISRMSGVQGELTDAKGKKTPKYKALMIWGNNPKKKNAPQFMAGGSTSPAEAIKGLQALLWFSEGAERDEIIAQIEALSKPEEQPQNLETTDNFPEEIDIVEVDKSIQQLSKNYIHEIDTILGVSAMDDKRKAMLKWIKDPKNNVRVIIAFSGGKDSVAMVLRTIYEFQIPKSQIELWHHEVDGAGENLFDWQCTPSYCQAFADAMGVPLLFSYSGGGILKEMYRPNDYRQPMSFQNEAGGE